ncbi:Tm-1-like ATP-binding domain-containing protein [Jannaschia ovalis]|uniref:Tm-1-like ATP-binding domain-containing protein n=1 Tax=Jannaschia ovalis TaxID=3038773 RepID=A0ABY8LD62_9RHOB|nr:Tm-1-like ATP-binding domain-containing protein [Jannaschia sp. GRR-S6-38]WGH79253.1 Tm-1-like ATP-binding domain-containing protein [Jannaschia sp. GRR-S6-38]
MAKVLLIGTFETKAQELTYLAAALRFHGLSVELMDVSLESRGAVWSGAEKLARMAARSEAAAREVSDHCTQCQAAIGVGGGTGGEIVLAAMRGLPSTYPKILITTLAFDPRPALSDRSITIIPTLCDIEGLNTQLRQVFENAAAAVAGLTNARPAEPNRKRSIAVTTLGATGHASAALARGLTDRGFEATMFHANGYGGAAYIRFVEEGHADAVIDLNVHELGRMRLAGAHVPMPTRFTVAAHLPRVVLPGALNFIGLGAIETVRSRYLARPHYRHTMQFTHVKLTEDEMRAQARRLADALNHATAPCHVILPMGGFSHQDRPGGAIEDPRLREIAADILEARARRYVTERVPHHINDAETATAVMARLEEAMTERMRND